MGWIYINLDQAIDIHERTVDVSGGGSYGHGIGHRVVDFQIGFRLS